MPWSDATYKLIMIVLVVAVGLLFLFVIAVPYGQKYLKLDDIIPGSNQETTDFENAMKCAYYRCVNGCDSKEINASTATWADPQTHSDVSCADFCTSGKNICNADSQNNPVRIDIGEKAYLAQDKLNSLFGTDCLVSTDFNYVLGFGGTDWLGFVQNFLTGEFSIIFAQLTQQKITDLRFVYVNDIALIDSDSVKYTHVDCYKSTTKIGSNAMSNLNLNPGKYQIAISHSDITVARTDSIFISAYQKTSSSNTQSSTQSSSCAAQGGNCKPVCSNAEQPLGALDCPQGGSQGTGKTCCK